MTFFQGQMAFTRCILFTRFTREQNTTCKGHLAFQKVIYSRESAIHSFSYPNIHSFYYECRKGTILQLLIYYDIFPFSSMTTSLIRLGATGMCRYVPNQG